MEQRIRDFEPLWNAINLGTIPRSVPLTRQTNEHHLLPASALVQWYAAEPEERAGIIAANVNRAFEFDADTEFVADTVVYRGPAPLIHDPLAYYDPDADDIYDMEFANY